MTAYGRGVAVTGGKGEGPEGKKPAGPSSFPHGEHKVGRQGEVGLLVVGGVPEPVATSSCAPTASRERL